MDLHGRDITRPPIATQHLPVDGQGNLPVQETVSGRIDARGALDSAPPDYRLSHISFQPAPARQDIVVVVE
jgi:hypothetical protein